MHYLTLLHCIAACLLLATAVAQEPNEYCNAEMTVCSCPETERTCHFEFAVQRLLTFTRYTLNNPTGTAGMIYIINDAGELEYVPAPAPGMSACNEMDVDCTQANTADGRTFRTFIGINGRLPGPTLVVYKNQTLVVDVINMLFTEVTTIHWHGFLQINTPWMDGAGIISQCPIEPGTTFRYIFRADDVGTHWYHSHSGAQRSEGLFGGLVVKDTSETEDYPITHVDLPEQHTLTLLDWQREDSTTLVWREFSKLRYFPASNEDPDRVPTSTSDFYISTQGVDGAGVGTFAYWSGLINGMGKHPDVAFNNSRLQVFTVQEGTTYRFRLIGAQNLYGYRFSIDGHKLTVIATDGNLVQPVVTDYIILFSGERYDFLLTANETGQSDYWMRAETLEAQFNNSAPAPYPFFPDHDARAVLHYNGSAIPIGPDYANIVDIRKSCTMDSPCITVNCPFQDYHPSYNITCINVDQLRLFYPTPPNELPSATYDEQYFMNFAFEAERNLATINGRANIPYKVSPQTEPDAVDQSTLCDLTDTCFPNGCFCTHQINIPYNKTIRFVFSSAGLGPSRRRFSHPIHLHGHEYNVVKIGYGTYNPITGEISTPTDEIVCQDGSTGGFCIQPEWKNGTGPEVTIDQYTVLKDTVALPALGYVIIHFKSTNPGWWFLHCHLEPHQLQGMALVVNEAQSRQPPPPPGMRTCGNFTWTVDNFTEALQFIPDTDECATGLHDCDPNAQCENTPGSFTCTCNPGYFGNGIFCTESDTELQFIADSPQLILSGGIKVQGDITVVFSQPTNVLRPLYKCTILPLPYGPPMKYPCDTGSFTASGLGAGKYQIVVRLIELNTWKTTTISRRIRVPTDADACEPYLINTGVTIDGPNAIVEWSSTGSPTGFWCKLDGEPRFQCSSPVDLMGLATGRHAIRIRSQCPTGLRHTRAVRFTV